jgi:predicted RNase H-like HicB family nuclease
MTIKAIDHSEEEGGFWAEVPALPGCHTQAESIEGLRVNLLEAIELYLEASNPEAPQNKGDQILEFAV